MAKPRKLVKDEDEATVYECQCGNKQTSDLTHCPQCHIPLCDTCMPFGSYVACVDCANPDSTEFDDEIDF